MKVHGLATAVNKDEYANDVLTLLEDQVHQALDRYEEADVAAPTVEEFAARLGGLVVGPGEANRNDLVGFLSPFWSSAKVRTELGLHTRQALDSRRRSGSILALKTSDGQLVFPVSQFHRTAGKVEVKPELRSIFSTLRKHDPWTVAVLLHTPAQELGALTPLDWVRHGNDTLQLVAFARRIDAEWSR